MSAKQIGMNIVEYFKPMLLIRPKIQALKYKYPDVKLLYLDKSEREKESIFSIFKKEKKEKTKEEDL
jgi:hypothetical protein